MSINLDLSPNSSSTNFSLKNISKELQICPNNSKNDSNLRNNMTLPLGNNISQTFNIKDLKESKQFNKINNSIYDNESNQDYESSLGNRNRLLYEKIKNKITFNKDNSSNLFNNFINMKITKSNSNKNLNNKNKENCSNNTNNITNNIVNNNLNAYNNSNSIEKRKKDKNQAKTSNYYDKYIINNNKNKSLKNKNQYNADDITKNKQENNKNFNINKYTVYENTYQNIYKSKKERIKTINSNNQINNCLNLNKNCMSDRLRENSIKNKNGFTKINNSSLDNIMISYSEIQVKKEKILNIFKNNKKVTSKEKAFYILSISPVLNLSEQIIFSRASENIRKVISINNIVHNNKIFLTMKAKELINEVSLCEKKINKPFTASKTADITLNFITTLDEQEFKDFDNLETNKKLVNIYYYYIKLFCILLNINYSNDLENEKIKNNLYEKIKERGFKYLKDYLYFIYISKNENYKILPKIDIINNEITNKCPDLLNIQQSIKLCRFTAFSNYLLKEILNYGNNLKDLFELKYRAQYFLEIVLGKIEKIENYKNKSKS